MARPSAYAPTQPKRQNVIRADAQVDARAVPEAQNHQACTGEQGDGERELDHDECVTETPASVPCRAATCLFQRIVDARSSSLPGLRRPAQRAGEHRRPNGEEQDRQVQSRVG
jgi:hypothetical protein